VKVRPYQYCILALGILAMLGSLMSVTLIGRISGPTAQLTLGHAAKASSVNHAPAMPCHKAAKPCPNCPKSICPDMAICLAKCVQQAPIMATIESVPLQTTAVVGWPVPAHDLTGSLIPPLLRPPIV
jgi:hypothetical protein